MQWEEYYEKVFEWAASTSVSRMSKLESFGPPEQIVEVIEEIGFDDEKGATRLLKKAVAAGIRFTAEQLMDLYTPCEETAVNDAVRFCADRFTTEDLDTLYCFCDEEVLLEIARTHGIKLPESLADCVQTEDEEEPDTEDICEEPEESVEEYLTPEELASEYDYILECLFKAHKHLVRGYKLAAIDAARGKRTTTILKYACVVEAQPYLKNALDAWAWLDIPGKDAHLLGDIWPNISNSTAWKNYLFGGIFVNILIRRRIYKVMRNVEAAHRQIRKLREELFPF